LGFDLSKATVSPHFETLRDAGFIRTRADGRRCLSSPSRTAFDERFPGLLKLVSGDKQK
jgi:DNA-binding transcriptional ArsR family regulator